MFEFGPFSLDAVERSLTRNGRGVPLTLKAFDTLLLLVQNGGQVVTKEDILKTVWPDSFVEESNIAVTVSAIRKALGEERKGRKHIETVSGKGYRFVSRVRRVGDDSRQSGGVRDLWGGAHSDKEGHHFLAVLPFTNGNKDVNLEYLSDGITESIINCLSQLPFLRVIARCTVFRYKGKGVEAREAGRELKVGAIITGRITRLCKQLTISVEMVNVVDGSQVWGERYTVPASDVFAAQEAVSVKVAERLRLKMTAEEKERLGRRDTENPEAYESYLKGRYFWNKYTVACVNRAIKYFHKAVESDPHYALAYAGLADSYYRLSNLSLPPKKALPKAKEMAIKAVDLDDSLADAHTSLGVVKLYWDHDFRGAEKEYLRAIELNPGTPLTRQRYGMCLLYTGRFDAALNELRKASVLDPLSLQINVSLATCLIFMGDYDAAIERMKEAAELDSNHHTVHLALGYAYMRKGDLTRAVSELRQTFELEREYHALGLMGYAYAVCGKPEKARAVIEELRKAARQRYVSPYHIATIHAGLGEKDEALELLERLYRDRNDYLTWLKVSPELRNLHSDARFIDLLRRVGLTADAA